jgi:predicted dehydrogenase
MAETADPERKWRWGILGTSFISDVMISAIQRSDHGEVYCVAGRTERSLLELCERHQIGVRYLSYDELLADPSVEIVYIGLPTYLHADWIKKCVQANKHILCEKSLTLNSAEANEVIGLLSSSSVFCLEAQMYRFHPIIPLLKETLHSQPFGHVLSVQGTFTAPIVDLFNRTAGGSILDLGCYPISLIRYLFGEPLSVRGSSVIISPSEPGQNNYDVDSTASLELPNGITATVIARNNEELKWEFIVTCETGTIQLTNLWDNSIDQAILLTSSVASDLSSKIVRNSAKDFYVLQIDAVNEAVSRGVCQAKAPGMTWEDSLNNMRTLDAWRDAVGLSYPMEKK